MKEYDVIVDIEAEDDLFDIYTYVARMVALRIE